MKQKILKVVFLGDRGAGKWCLIFRLANDWFSEHYPPGLGMDFYTKRFIVDEEEIILQLWNRLIFSLEGSKILAHTYFIGASGLILIYDITNATSFKNLEDWLQLFRTHALGREAVIPKVLLGCKADLEEDRSVSKQEARDFANKHDINIFFECSAKTGENVEEAFLALISEINQVNKNIRNG